MADSPHLTIDEDEVLIQLVEAWDLLYDKSSDKYKDNERKKKAWDEIASDMYLVTNRPMEATVMAKRWRSLKQRYMSERRIMREYIPSGSAAPASKPQWKYYATMQFLEKHVQHRRTFSNFQTPVEEGFHMSSDEDDPDDDAAGEDTQDDSVECLEDKDLDDPKAVSIPARQKKPIEINGYLLVLRDAWNKIPERNRKKCFFELRDVVRNKKKQLPSSP